jgi:hypothetical protein
MGWKRIDPIAPVLMRRIESAIEAGGNDTLAKAVISAKQNHGWKNQTGTLEGSYRLEPMQKVGASSFRGLFGSFDVAYAVFLELGTRFIRADYTLRRAADAEFPAVGQRIQEHMR